MKISLDPMQGYVKEGKFDQKRALISTGVKAAICFKEATNGVVTPEMIREDESEAVLINRGLNTIYSDHTTPSEHQIISLEITDIPKILCMVLNNEKQYSADERSLRYTEVEPNKYITEEEVRLYNKWINIFENVITKKLGEFYLKTSKTEKMAKAAIHRLAQENARYMVSVFMPTTITYTVPWIQINKVMSYMQNIINNPENELESLLVPYLVDFINQCKKIGVAITKDSIYNVANSNQEIKEKLYKSHPEIENYQGNDDLLYKNNKDVNLSMFANRNKFSGINNNNEFGYNISFNNMETWACFAQEQRHRTINCEMIVPEEFKAFLPPIISDDEKLSKEWLNDIKSVSKVYPQGQLIMANRCMTVRNCLKFVAQERCCDRAQLEIERVYVDDIIPNTYKGLVENGHDALAKEVEPYVKKLRCGFPGYHCPGTCGHPRINREL